MGWVKDNAQLLSVIAFPKGFHLISRHSIGQFTQNVFLLLKTRDAGQWNGPRPQVFGMPHYARDTSATVKDVHLVLVYIKKQWKSSPVE